LVVPQELAPLPTAVTYQCVELEPEPERTVQVVSVETVGYVRELF
jgi:hypothetical protein